MLRRKQRDARWIARVLLAMGALSEIGCGNDKDAPPTGAGPGGPEAGVDTSVGADSARDVTIEPQSDVPADTSLDVRSESSIDGSADTPLADQSARDSVSDGSGRDDVVDGDAGIADQSTPPEASRPDGGPVTGPGCGGCFADEIESAGQCFANTSCGSPPNAVMMRVNATCQIHSCHPGWGDCDGRADTGCETDFMRPDNCGRCGNACASSQVCGASGCVAACAPPTVDCGGSCVDVSTSPLHCGMCFQACTDLQWHRPVCANGTCSHEKICAPGTAACSSGCTVLDEDPGNCGMCGRGCSTPAGGTVSCRVGVCVPHCPTGFTLCGNACVDLQSDPAHCNACGRSCGAGGCVAGACDATWSPVVATGTAPTALAVDATSVYWLETQAGRVMKAPKGGGSAAQLATGQSSPFDLALDTTYVYWSNRTGNAVMRIAKTGGGSPQLVVRATEPMHIATDGTSVFFEQPPTAVDAGAGTYAPGQALPPIVRRTRIGTSVAEDFWVFPYGDTDGTLTQMLAGNDGFLYWAGRRRTVPSNYFTFQIDVENGATARAYPGVWGELAQDATHIFMTTGSGATGVPVTVAALSKISGIGWGILQFQPGATYDNGGFMTAGDTYLYRSSPGELEGVHKFLKCGTHNLAVNLTGANRWSYLVADGPSVYGIFGAEIRRVHR